MRAGATGRPSNCGERAGNRPEWVLLVSRTDGHRTPLLMTSDIARSEVRLTDPARLERAATLAMLRAGRILTG